LPQQVDFLLSLCRPVRLIRWTTFFLALMLLWVALNYTTLQSYFAAREQRNTYRESVAGLKAEKKKLKRHAGELEDGGFQVEKTIRERLKMARPGEKIIFVQPPAPPAAQIPENQKAP
jgi:cell division protein FtsB